MSKNFVYS